MLVNQARGYFFSQLLPLLTYGMGKTNGVLVVRLLLLLLAK